MFLVVDDVPRFVDRYAAYLGAAAVARPHRRTFPLALSAVSVIDVRDAAKVLPGSLLPPVPCIAGVAFSTPDLAELPARLRAAGIRFGAHGGRIVVPAEEAFGLALVFESPQQESA